MVKRIRSERANRLNLPDLVAFLRLLYRLWGSGTRLVASLYLHDITSTEGDGTT